MKLWIRSQDKKRLIACDNVYIFSHYNIAVNIGETVGIYKTEERAIEILDEIQELLSGKLYLPAPIECDNKTAMRINHADIEIKELLSVVYEMPKE